MTSLPEQLSAARKSQLDTQFRLLHTFTNQAFDNAGRLMALNLAVSRDAVERSSRTVRGLLAASGPRDLNLLRSHAEEQVRSMFAYGHELMGIASGLRLYSAPLTTPKLAPAALPSPTQVAQSVIEAAAPAAKAVEDAMQAGADDIGSVTESVQTTVSATVAVPEVVPAAVPVIEPPKETAQAADSVEATLSALVQEQALKDEPAVVQNVEADALAAAPLDTPTPVGKPKPIAKAAGKGAPKAAVVPHPMAAPVEARDSASIKASVTRIDSAPPKRRK
jgi:hypothetical protein